MFFPISLPRALTFSVTLLAVPAFAAWADGGSFAARVVGVPSGDRLKITYGDVTEFVALYGVFEEGVPLEGEDAQTYSEKLVLERDVDVEVVMRRGGVNWVKVVLPSGHRLNEELVQEGLAKWDRLTAPEAEILEMLEAQARSAGLGIWAGTARSRPAILDLPLETVLVPKRLHPGPGRVAEAILIREADGSQTLVARGNVLYNPQRRAEIQSRIAERRALAREAAIAADRERDAYLRRIEREQDEANLRAHEWRMRDLREEELRRKIERDDRRRYRSRGYVYTIPFFRIHHGPVHHGPFHHGPVHHRVIVKKTTP